MEHSLSFDPSRSAVLSMDLQTGIVGIYTKVDREFSDRAADVLKAARNRQMCVVHVQVGFRPGLPEVSSRNSLFATIKKSAQHQQLFTGPLGAIHSALAPEADEVVVTKHRVATSGVVLSTLLHASDQDYRLLVIKDCCADLDAEVDHCLVEKVFPGYAAVTTSD